MAMVENGDRREILRMVDGSLGLVRLHHGDGLGPEGGTQPLQLRDQMRHVGVGVRQDDRLQRLGMGQRIVDAEPAAPGMAEQMDPAEAERLAYRLGLGDVAPMVQSAASIGRSEAPVPSWSKATTRKP